jgi:hypothetical protein
MCDSLTYTSFVYNLNTVPILQPKYWSIISIASICLSMSVKVFVISFFQTHNH